MSFARAIPRVVAGALALVCLGSCQRQSLPPDAFVVLLDSQPKGLDPRFPVADASAKIIGLLHAGLVSTDTASGEPELELAEAIEQVNPTTYAVRLRADARFHDGRPVTSEDVRYTLMELDKPPVKSALGGLTKRIARFEIADARRFTITLKEPYAPFMVDLSIGVVPKHVCGGLAQCPEDAPVGAGPFKFVRREGSHLFVLERFEGYLGGAPRIKTLAFKVVKDDNTRLLALLGQSADLVQNAVSPLMLPVVKDDKRLQVQTAPSSKYTYLAFNLRHPALAKLKVRQAIAHGLDREAIIKHKYRGLARLATGLLAPGHWAYTGEVERFGHDPERARKLLDEAGYPDPDGDGPLPRLKLEIKVSSNKFRRALAALMAFQLAQIGIEVRVRSYEWGTYFHDIKTGNFELTTLQWPSVLEPSLYRWIFHSENIPSPERKGAGANRGAYRNKRVDLLLDQGMVETDRAKRAAIYAEVQQILARELPYVSLWHEDNIAVLKRGVSGYTTTPNARFEALKVTQPAPVNAASR